MSSPQVIFGCASLGKSFTTKEEVEKLGKALHNAHISRIDTAARYPPTSPGASERLIGEASYGEKFTIDTKVMVSGDASGSLTATNIGKSLENSLKLLGVVKVSSNEFANYISFKWLLIGPLRIDRHRVLQSFKFWPVILIRILCYFLSSSYEQQ